MQVVGQSGNEVQLEKPLSSREVAELLGCNHKTIERHAKRGNIPAHFRLGRWYFLWAEVDEWLRDDLNSNCQPCCVN